MRSAHQTPSVPKVGGPRSKSVHKSKVKESAKKNLPTKQMVWPILQLQQDIVVIDPED